MPTDLPLTSEVISNIQETLAEFCLQCTEWDRHFETLLDEFDNLDLSPVTAVIQASALDGGGTKIDELQRRIASENCQLLERQDSISRDLADLRQLVIDQTEAFSSYFGTKHESPATQT